MIKLVCQKCNHIWYTANTRSNQKCHECGGYLREIELINIKENERVLVGTEEKKNECKILHIDFN